MTTKPDCYECKFRGNVPGSDHSSCIHPEASFRSIIKGENPLGVTANIHGVMQGWFIWPIDFDPRWLENCEGFEQK